MSRNRLSGTVIASLTVILFGAFAKGSSDYSELLALHQEVRQFGSEYRGVYQGERIREATTALKVLQGKFEALDVDGWTVSWKIDYLLVKSRLAESDFEHRVVRSWARDPMYYLDMIKAIPYADVPESTQAREELQQKLAEVPEILREARNNLTMTAKDLSRLAVFHLERFDGVGQREPIRESPPPGIIGWFRDLKTRVGSEMGELSRAAGRALESVELSHTWLVQRQPDLREPAAVGLDHYNWFLENVRLMPYTAEQLGVLSEREVDRSASFLAIERNRNREVPQLQLASSKEEYDEWVGIAERQIREIIVKKGLLTIPSGTSDRFETDAFYVRRPGGKRHFWEELQYRNPLNNHIHASIPGHRFDFEILRLVQNPIRQAHRDGGRAEGWAFYIEELFLQSGLMDEIPRARELFYIAHLARAVRIPAELRLQTGEFDLQQAIDYMVGIVPFMEPDLARYDLEVYLRRPAYGMNYTAGKMQVEQLLGEQSAALGESFDLGEFHDRFLSYGMTPISLIRWDMTGKDDQVKRFLKK